MSQEYILLVLLEKCEKRAVLAQFSYIPGGLEGLFDFFDSVHHHPLARHSPRQ
jgi:hypothetical protein